MRSKEERKEYDLYKLLSDLQQTEDDYGLDLSAAKEQVERALKQQEDQEHWDRMYR